MAKKVILCIDDTADVRTLVRETLEKEGYQIITLPNPQNAFEILDNNSVGLIICDLTMPYQNGFDFLRELRRHKKHKETPLIFLTNVSTDIAIGQATKLGANGYFFKYETTPEKLKINVSRFL